MVFSRSQSQGLDQVARHQHQEPAIAWAFIRIRSFLKKLSYRPSEASLSTGEDTNAVWNLAQRVVFNVKVINRGLFKGKTKVYKIRGGKK